MKKIFILLLGVVVAVSTACVKQVGDFQDGLAVAVKGGKYGFVNEQKQVIIPFSYDTVESFQDGYAKVFLKNKCGMINKKGELILNCEYDDYRFDSITNFFAVTKENKWGWVINKQGKKIRHYLTPEAEARIDAFFERGGSFEVRDWREQQFEQALKNHKRAMEHVGKMQQGMP